MDDKADQSNPAPDSGPPESEVVVQRYREPSTFKPGDVIRDRFRLISLLGVGGMSQVYLAEDLRRIEAGDHDAKVALKFLQHELAERPDAFAILQREARRMQHLAHPNIAQVYDFDVYQGIPFLVMEYVAGTALDELFRRSNGGAPMALRSAVAVISEMAAGLSYAHQRGVVHLDFKPGNVFILPTGQVKIFDFGIARGLSEDMDSGSVILGAATPAYSSPQALKGETPRVSDDVFSFGVVVYELLSGRHPFGRRTDWFQIPLVPQPLVDLSRRQWSVLRAALEFHPERRPASVTEIAAAFDVTSVSVRARRLVEHVQRWIRGLRPGPSTISVAPESPGGTMWVADRPIHAPAEDDLQYIDYAKALFGVIDHPKTTPPLTIAINGPFGIGKSSVALLTQHLLANKLEDRGEKRHITAWMLVGRYRGSPNLRASFVRDFIRDLYYAQSLWFRLRNHLPSRFLMRDEVRKRRLLYVALLIVVGVSAALLAQEPPDGLEALKQYSGAVGFLSSCSVALVLWIATMMGPLKSLADYVDPDYDSANATHHSEARKQVEKMIEKLTRGGRRFVLFVDDLERSPERTPEVLDILEGMFSMPSCIVVIPTDLDVLGAALEQHANVRVGRRYLEKYVQLQFDMPSVESARLIDLLTHGQQDEEPLPGNRQVTQEPALGNATIAGARDRIDAAIRNAGVTQVVVNSELVVPARRWEQLVDERKQRALTDTDIYKNALRHAVSLAGRDVRAAKRISNHVRLYVFVLFHRGLLHSQSTLTAAHVGQWIAFKELWPDVIALVNQSPSVYRVLDEWAADGNIDDALTALKSVANKVPSVWGGDLVTLLTTWPPSRIDSFRGFLKGEPSLASVVDQLCYLRHVKS